jgi:hypothetical protein
MWLPRAITTVPAETAAAIAAAWSATETGAFVGATRTGRIVASGAMPAVPAVPSAVPELAATMPAPA